MFRRAAYFLAAIVACAPPSLAAAPRSACEIRVNRFAAAHPQAGPTDYLNAGFFYFGRISPPHPPPAYRDLHPSIAWIGAPGGGFGAHFIGPFTPTPDATANARIIDALVNHMDRAYTRAMGRPQPGGRFIAIAFTSSQQGYVDIRNGDFYFMGQN